ncbi:MAG TPA: O-antigen ligase family protein [Candidatus Acidoferrales bacterium]|nr:O-antigen ligase family protein [Candidatus Acidoferrales bacterium]
MRLRLAWIALLAIAIYGVLLGGSWLGVYTAQLRVATMVVSAALLGCWAAVAWRQPEWRPRSALWPAIVAVLVSLTVSTITSRSPRVSVEYLGYAVVLIALYLLLVRLLAHEYFRGRIVAFASMLFVVLVVVYVGLTVIEWVLWWTAVGHLAVPPLRPGFSGLTYGNPSAVLVLVVMLALPFLVTFASTTRRGIAAAVGALVGIGLVALISGSRAGWLAMALTALLSVGIWALRPDRRAWLLRTARSHLESGRQRAFLGAIGLALVALVIVLAPPILQRVTAGGEAVRVNYSVAAIRIFLTSPLVGTGPGTWAFLRPAFTARGEYDDYVPYAHNLETQTLSELGLVGAVGGLVVVASMVWLVATAFRGPSTIRRRWAVGAAIGITYFGLHQLLDFFENMPAILFAAAIPIAWLDATSEAVPAIRGRHLAWPGRLTAVLTVLAIAALTGLTLQEIPAMRADEALAAANRGDWGAADGPALAASSADPGMPPYAFTAGLAASWDGDHPTAARLFEQVLLTDDIPEAWLNLAAEHLAMGDTSSVRSDIQRALRIGLSRAAVAMAAGDLALRVGDLRDADQAFGAVLDRFPSVGADPWWHANVERSAALQRAVSALIGSGNPYRWELALMVGDAAQAQLLASRLPSPDLPRHIIRAWAGDPDDTRDLFAQCDANPLDAPLLYWCARIAGHDGDTESQFRYRFIATLTPDLDFDGGGEIRVSRLPLVGRQLAGNPSIWWGFYVYRRATPWDVLVPSLVHLTLQ